MKIAICADVHLANHKRYGGELVGGLNVRCRQSLEVFEQAVNYAVEEDCAAFVVAGDLFDDCRPEPALLAEVQHILWDVRTELQVILIRGNHEEHSDHDRDHSLAPLGEHARIITKPTLVTIKGWPRDRTLFAVPYKSAPAKEWLAAAFESVLDGVVEPPALCAVHLGISDDNTAHFLMGAHDSVNVDVFSELLSSHGIPVGVAGNWHDHIYWPGEDDNPAIVQCGALVPTGWDNPGLDGYGTVVIVDTESIAPVAGVHLRHLPGPRFVKAMSVADAQSLLMRSDRMHCKPYVQMVLSGVEAGDVAKLLRDVKREDNPFHGVEAAEVLVNKEESYAQTRAAAFSARSEGTLNEALAAFVREMPLTDESMRPRVLERVQGYLKTGRG